MWCRRACQPPSTPNGSVVSTIDKGKIIWPIKREKVRVTDMRAQHTRTDGVIKLRRHPSHIRWSDDRTSSNASLAIKKEIVCKLLLVWLVLSGVLCVYSSVRPVSC
ncbi:hypothetical protein NP493_625g01053 [Ridgeia piscesae]|uniref:Uncharacterized protein n=1 Tax=Ridgeia piscesae TaxID=27915 RepID=A0AAD9KSJ0_RIDPI|nr:hypothetical protein NP493_625g01053 [Ridgeia piscesae]